jgi:hypothetical protein
MKMHTVTHSKRQRRVDFALLPEELTVNSSAPWPTIYCLFLSDITNTQPMVFHNPAPLMDNYTGDINMSLSKKQLIADWLWRLLRAYRLLKHLQFQRHTRITTKPIQRKVKYDKTNPLVPGKYP